MGAVKDQLGRLKAGVLSRIAARPMPRDLAEAACSITFDDVPRSAIDQGVPILERFGTAATFYVASGMDPVDFFSADDMRSLAAQGHDLACHTLSHYSLYGGNADELASDAAQNRAAFVDEIGVSRPRDFSYPFGEVSVRAKRLIGSSYATARSVYEGLNSRGSDLLLLRANPLYSHRVDWDQVRMRLAAAVESRSWIIFYTHGVEAEPDPWSCVPEDLERLLEECRAAKIPFRTVRSVSEELLPDWS